MRTSCVRLVFAMALSVVAFGGSAWAGVLVPSVPEVDAGSMAAAITLLSGAALVITNRVRRGKSG